MSWSRRPAIDVSPSGPVHHDALTGAGPACGHADQPGVLTSDRLAEVTCARCLRWPGYREAA